MMKKKKSRTIEQILTYLPLAGVIGASVMDLTMLQRQFLILIFIIWMNTFFLFKAWMG
ncbi:MAG: hypothetical protein M1485_06550 [Chloroflexi bacterium]|nr:hypothetical protein [Chloroflexota bacterium]